MAVKRSFAVLLVISLILPLGGCWDRKEVETRGFVLGVAIDQVSPEEADAYRTGAVLDKRQDFERVPVTGASPVYRMTLQFPVIKRAKPTGPTSGGGGEEAAFWNISGVGPALYAINREFNTRVSIAPFYEHMQVLVISESVARGGIRRLLDFFFRDPEMRRRTRVFVTEQDAASVLQVKPQIEDYTPIYLERIPENDVRNARIASKVDLGVLSQNIHSGTDFVIPKVTPWGRELKVAGGTVFKGDKMVGWLSEDELQAAKYAFDAAKGDFITVPCPEHPHCPTTVEINRASTSTKVTIQDSRPSFALKVQMGGNLSEQMCDEFDDVFEPSFLRKVEAQVAKHMQDKIESTMARLQRELQADVTHLGTEVHRQQPDTWKQIKDNWAEIYPTVDVSVKVEVNLKLVGTARQSP